MNNIMKVVDMGICVGCGACDGCEHIVFINNALGFPSPVVNDTCIQCGECLRKCIYWNDEPN